MTNVTPGDLAYITSKVHAPELKGQFVIVLRPAYDGDRNERGASIAFEGYTLPAWWIRAAREGDMLLQTVRHTNLFTGRSFIEKVPAAEIALPDAVLRRIAGPGIDISETTTKDKDVATHE